LVGRIAYINDEGPMAVPVNFTVIDDHNVFRRDPGDKAVGAEGDRMGIPLGSACPPPRSRTRVGGHYSAARSVDR